MNQFDKLIEFEKKYPSLYDIEINGFPVYTVMRQGLYGINARKIDSREAKNINQNKKYISFRRIVDSFIGIHKHRSVKVLIFSSSSYRRDHLHNFGVEYLQKMYPDSIAFEWPNHNRKQDLEYKNEKDIIPIDYYLVLSKLYSFVYRKEYNRLYNDCLNFLEDIFKKKDNDFFNWIDYLKKNMCSSYAKTGISHIIFSKLFKNYYPNMIIDFFGSARENIYPVFMNNPELIELQHGILTKEHTGYIYPDFVKKNSCYLFNRKILVYGESSKNILCNYSVFEDFQIEIIGNPRIKMYLNSKYMKIENKILILFTSQPFEQDGICKNYYNTIIPYLNEILNILNKNKFYMKYKLGIKLHPREGNNIIDLYKKHLGKDVFYYGNDAELYDLLVKSYLHITVNSTCLYEATQFKCPTITIKYGEFKNKETFGEQVIEVSNIEELNQCFNNLETKYNNYLSELQKITKEFMGI